MTAGTDGTYPILLAPGFPTALTVWSSNTALCLRVSRGAVQTASDSPLKPKECPVPTHPLQNVPGHPLQFGFFFRPGDPALDHGRALDPQVDLANQSGAVVDLASALQAHHFHPFP